MQFDFVAFLLLTFYVGILILETKQISDMFWVKNKIINYRNSIIFVLACSAFLRVIFWAKVLSPSYAPGALMMTIFYLPVWLNFAALSLLSVFYANAIYQKRYGNWPWIICLIVNVIFFSLNITIGVLVGKQSIVHNFYIAYAVFLDALIAIIVGYFGYYFVHNQSTQRNWILPRPIEEFSFVNWIIVACFLVRSFMVALLSTDLIESKSSSEVQFSGSHAPTSLTLLFFFVVSEWIPNSAMLYLLWKSSFSTERGKSAYTDIDNCSEIFCTVSESDLRDNLLVRQTSIEDSIVKVIFNADEGDDPVEDFDEGEDDDCFEDRDFSFTKPESVWSVDNTVVSALYRTPSPQVTSLKGTDYSGILANLVEAERRSSGEIGRRSHHLDPNTLYTAVSMGDSCDLNEMYSDTLGPRDILISDKLGAL